MDREHLPRTQRVQLLRSAARVRWGTWDLVNVVLRSLRWARDNVDADWFVLLSGQDYPVTPPDAIDAFFAEAGSDAFVYWEPVDPRPRIGWPMTPEAWTTRRYFYRYSARPVLRADPAHRVGRAVGDAARVMTAVQSLVTLWPFPDGSVHVGVRQPRAPFSDRFRCFKGSQWFTASRRAVELLLARAAGDVRLVRHYQRCVIPDESFFLTILLNAPSLNVRNGDLRFAGWADGAAHPDVLTIDQVDAALASGMHFARKFDVGVDPRAMDEIDRRLGLAGPGRRSSSSR
jgi:hypothetical protein